jgi:hypothetical protein
VERTGLENPSRRRFVLGILAGAGATLLPACLATPVYYDQYGTPVVTGPVVAPAYGAGWGLGSMRRQSRRVARRTSRRVARRRF